MNKLIALLLSLSIVVSGCATRHTTMALPAGSPQESQALSASVARIPIGTRLRVDLTSGERVRGTLMRVSDTSMLVNRRTRVPEPPVEIAFSDVQGFDIDQGGPGNVAKIIALSAAAGAAVAVGTMWLLAAILIDD